MVQFHGCWDALHEIEFIVGISDIIFFFGYVVALFVRFRLLSLITVNGVVEA